MQPHSGDSREHDVAQLGPPGNNMLQEEEQGGQAQGRGAIKVAAAGRAEEDDGRVSAGLGPPRCDDSMMDLFFGDLLPLPEAGDSRGLLPEVCGFPECLGGWVAGRTLILAG